MLTFFFLIKSIFTSRTRILRSIIDLLLILFGRTPQLRFLVRWVGVKSYLGLLRSFGKRLARSPTRSVSTCSNFTSAHVTYSFELSVFLSSDFSILNYFSYLYVYRTRTRRPWCFVLDCAFVPEVKKKNNGVKRRHA